MAGRPILYDAVTLRHLAVAGQLDTCRRLYEDRPWPRWTDGVSKEIAEGVRIGEDECLSVQEAAWLGSPIEPELIDLAGIRRLWIALNLGSGSTGDHGGEAETIYFADQTSGVVATDDNAAHDFAARRLGPDRAIDTVDILRAAVRSGVLTAVEAATAAADVTDAGRHLRRVHPRDPPQAYFG